MQSKIKNLLGAAIIGGSIMSFGTSALANVEPTNPNQVYTQVPHEKHHFNDMMTDLVAKKIISQEQADKWVEFRKAKMPERQAEREKIKNMTKEERRAYWQNERPKRLDEVVKAGIISQEQANKIKELWCQNCKQQ